MGDKAPEEIHAVVEIPAKSKVKYELDKDTGADYSILTCVASARRCSVIFLLSCSIRVGQSSFPLPTSAQRLYLRVQFPQQMSISIFCVREKGSATGCLNPDTLRTHAASRFRHQCSI